MHRLISAQTEAEIVAIVRDYLGGWHPRELAELPSACRPGVIRDGEDLAGLRRRGEGVRWEHPQASRARPMEKSLSPAYKPHVRELASRIYVDLVTGAVSVGEGGVKMAASAENLAKLSFQLAEA